MRYSEGITELTTSSNKEISSLIEDNDIVRLTGEFFNREKNMYLYLDDNKVTEKYGYYFGAYDGNGNLDALEINKEENEKVDVIVHNLS